MAPTGFLKISFLNLFGNCFYFIFFDTEILLWQDRLMHFPTWIDLKGQDSVPETVHHVVSEGLHL